MDFSLAVHVGAGVHISKQKRQLSILCCTASKCGIRPSVISIRAVRERTDVERSAF